MLEEKPKAFNSLYVPMYTQSSRSETLCKRLRQMCIYIYIHLGAILAGDSVDYSCLPLYRDLVLQLDRCLPQGIMWSINQVQIPSGEDAQNGF